MINVNYTLQQFEALSELDKLEAVSEVTRDWCHGGVKKVNDIWVCDPNGINEEVEIGFMTGEYLKPVYKHTVCLEAVLRPESIRAYAKEHKISFQDALEALGKEYVSKYYQYSGTYIEGHTTEISYLGKDKQFV